MTTEYGAAEHRSHRVLVVDDNVYSALSLAQILNSWGHSTRIAHEGREAISVAKSFRPDVVLLDIGLPGMDGYAVARSIRGEPECRDAVLLAVTGHDRDADRLKVIEAGFYRHLVKPLELDELEILLAGRTISHQGL